MAADPARLAGGAARAAGQDARLLVRPPGLPRRRAGAASRGAGTVMPAMARRRPGREGPPERAQLPAPAAARAAFTGVKAMERITGSLLPTNSIPGGSS